MRINDFVQYLSKLLTNLTLNS